jgi:hypothetical protein
MAGLPALKETDLVEAPDLAGHYHADSKAAEARYRGRRFVLQGEVVGFEKPAFRRNYRILLNTGARQTKVICDLQPPDNMSAVFTINHGEELVGLIGSTRTPLAKLGDRLEVTGRCSGHHDGAVLFDGLSFKVAQ